MPLNIHTIFEKAVEAGASDVHLTVGYPVLYRIDGALQPQTKGALDAKETESFAKTILGKRFAELEKQREIDVAFAVKGGARLRLNAHFDRGSVGIVARIVPTEIPTLDAIGLTALGEQLKNVSEGLVLFTGPTGAGKSTALASLIQHLFNERSQSIVTLEDPIEFLFAPKNAVIVQRELGSDFLSFAEALKRVLRQDPNIVMVGEMRDPETVAAALTLAETGHLILATLHTPNAIQTIDRIIDVFPAHQQNQVRAQLSLSLRAVVAQKLLPKEGGGRVATREVLLNTNAAANIIRSSRIQDLASVMQTGSGEGMYTFDKDIKRLYKESAISKETYNLALS